MNRLLIVPSCWVSDYQPLPAGWLESHAPGLLRVWPEAAEAIDRAARLCRVSAKLLVTRIELEQTALTYAWDGALPHYRDLPPMTEEQRSLLPPGARGRLANEGDAWKLFYLCGVDKTDEGPRRDGWFGPERQLLGCGARFRFLYRGDPLPTDLAEAAPPLPEALRGLGESDLYHPGIPVTRGTDAIVPANQVSADCLRYTTSMEAQRRLRAFGLECWPEDYAAEDAANPPADRRLKVVLDPGHGTLNADGKRDTGTAGGDLPEHEANLEVALRLEKLLLGQGHTVILTRRECDWTRALSPGDRGRFSAAQKADVFVSVHHDGSVKPEMRGCHGFYHDERAPKGKALATALAAACHAEFGVPYSYGAPASDWFGNQLGVLRGGDNWAVTDAAALVECMFMTNAEDLAIIRSEGYYDRAAKALATAIHTYAGLAAPDDWEAAEPPGPTEWEQTLAEAAEWARERGVSDGTRLGEPATRGEVLVMLRRAVGDG